MKYCPICGTRYDEEIMHFCMKDGTPLVEEETPVFSELPSETAEDDFDEETVIRRNNREVSPAPETLEKNVIEPKTEDSSPRLVIPTTPEKPFEQPQVRTRPIVYSQPQKINTAKIVLLSILGTLIVLATGGILFTLFSNSNNSGENINYNTNLPSQEINLNTNLPVNSSLFNASANANLDININTDFNTNFNTNFNANFKTPTPKPSATPTVSPTPEENTNANENSNTSNANAASPNGNSRTNTNARTPLPTPSPSARPANRSLGNSLSNSEQ